MTKNKNTERFSSDDEVACDWWKVESLNEKPKNDEIGRNLCVEPNNRLGVMMNDDARRIVLRLFACMHVLSTHSHITYKFTFFHR